MNKQDFSWRANDKLYMWITSVKVKSVHQSVCLRKCVHVCIPWQEVGGLQ